MDRLLTTRTLTRDGWQDDAGECIGARPGGERIESAREPLGPCRRRRVAAGA